MKKFLALILVLSISSLLADEDYFFLRKKPKPAPVVQIEDAEEDALDEEDEDEDEKVVLENVSTMLQAIGLLSTDSTNPAVAGPAIAAFGISAAKIIVQMFKSIDIRSGEITQEHIEQWFNNLPEKTKVELITLMIAFGQAYQNNTVLIIE